MGYDISDFRDINPRFGTMQDLRNLLKKAKKLGIKVILDLVPNHTSDKHEWFQKSLDMNGKYADYYIWANCVKNGNVTTPPNNWVSVFNGTAWTWHEKRKQCYFHQFYPQQPDLNYNNPDVQEEMKEIMRFWLNVGIDGFRIDAVPHLFENKTLANEPVKSVTGAGKDDFVSRDHIYTKDQPDTYKLVQSWRDFVDEYAKNENTSEKVLLTEAYTTLNNTLHYYKYGSNVPFNFNFIVGASATSNATDFKTIIDNWIAGTPSGDVPNWVMGNHDRTRIGTRYPDREDQMVMLEMILPGVAVTYYGEEIGMVDNTKINRTNGDFRDGCRTPFQWNNSISAGFSSNPITWLPVNENYETLNLETEKTDPDSHYNIYKSLIKLRNSTLLKDGSLQTTVLKDLVLAVVRKDSKESAALLINFNNNSSVTVDLSGLMEHAKAELAMSSFKSGLKRNATYVLTNITIPAKASMILIASSGSSIAYSMVTVSLALCVLIFRM
ncbi:unnamed protein product [Xylocopa violacea]